MYRDENIEVIETAAHGYFLTQHVKAGLGVDTFSITIRRKEDGIQTGAICDVMSGAHNVRYYIKTHQHGPTFDNVKSIRRPDTKEVFVYKLLHRIGIGPQTHFLIPSHSTTSTIFIATMDCHLTLLSDLTQDTAKINALLQLDLISRILCLHDCTTNPSNCGQVGDKAMIVDFRIETHPCAYAKADILEKFYEGNSEFEEYSGLMQVAMGTPNDVKKDIIKKSLEDWKLFERIDETESEIDELVRWHDGKINFENDLQVYVRDLKETIEVLMKC